MRTIQTLLAAASLSLLVACGGQGDDTAGDQAAQQADASADAMEQQADQAADAGMDAQADAMSEQADATREAGEEQEEAIDWFAETNGSGREEVSGEVDRYCAWPGQACGYKIGHSEINRQRSRAQAALGARYDIKAFNDAVVLGGNVPMDVLAKNVDEYVRMAQA